MGVGVGVEVGVSVGVVVGVAVATKDTVITIDWTEESSFVAWSCT